MLEHLRWSLSHWDTSLRTQRILFNHLHVALYKWMSNAKNCTFTSFWSIAGVAVLVAPHIPLNVGVESRQQFCLQTTPSMTRLPLQYTVCVGDNIRSVYQESIQQLSRPNRELPSMNALWYSLLTWPYALW